MPRLIRHDLAVTTSLCAVFFTFLAFLPPPAIRADELAESTPASSTLANPTANFGNTPYAGAAGSSISATITLTLPVNDTHGYSVTAPTGWTLSHASSNSGCTATGSGNVLSGSVTVTAAPLICTIYFTIAIPNDATIGHDYSLFASIDQCLVNAGEAGIDVQPTAATIAFDKQTYGALPAAMFEIATSVNFNGALSDRQLNVQLPQTTPPSLRLINADIRSTGDAKCTVEYFDAQGTYHFRVNANGPGSCTSNLTMFVEPEATPGPMGDFSATMTGAQAQHAAFAVLDPSTATADFASSAYAALPQSTFLTNLTISFAESSAGGAYAIVNPAPSMLDISVFAIVNTGEVSCLFDSDAGNDAITGTAAAPGPGSCIVTFIVTVHATAEPGPIGYLTANLPGGNPVSPASFTVLEVPGPPAPHSAAVQKSSDP